MFAVRPVSTLPYTLPRDSRTVWERLQAVLRRGLRRHPILTCSFSLMVMGGGMTAAVTAAVTAAYGLFTVLASIGQWFGL